VIKAATWEWKGDDEQMTVLIISTGRVRKDDRFTAQICTRGELKQAEMERKGWN
jgi:hypothetical protein